MKKTIFAIEKTEFQNFTFWKGNDSGGTKRKTRPPRNSPRIICGSG
jgi:hypothetical protein